MKRDNYRFADGNGLEKEVQHSLVFRLRDEIDFLKDCMVKADIKHLQVCESFQKRLDEAEKEIETLRKLNYKREL